MVGTGGLRTGWRLLAAAALVTVSAVGGALGGSSPARAATLTINLFVGPGNIEYGQPLGTSAILSADPQGGTVTFYADSVPIPNCTNLPAGIAQITCNYRWLDPATYDIRAEFNGSPTYDPAASQTEQQRVYQANTVIGYTGPTITPGGQAVNVSAHLETSYWERAIVGEPVTFSFAGGDSCIGTTDATGEARCEITMPAFGATLTITYAGSTGYAAETITASITTLVGPTTTSLLVSPLGGPVGTSILLHAVVDPAAATGSIGFKNGALDVPGCGNVALVGGEALCATDELPVGAHSLSAVYAGSPWLAASISPVTTVTMSQHAMTLTAGGASTATVGTPYTLSSTLFDNDLGAASVGQNVTMSLGSQSCSATTNGGGVATCAVTPTTAAALGTTMTFAGTATLRPATAAPKQVSVGKGATTTTAASAGGRYLAPVHIDAVVSPSDGAGMVEFFDGASVISGCGSVPLALVAGNWTARCTTSTLSVGAHPVTAVFGGSSNYTGSTSQVATVTISAAPTATSLAAPASTVVYTTPASFVATVAPTDGTGPVAFSIGGAPIAGCEAVALADAGGGWRATCTTSSLPVGTSPVTAAYAGTVQYATSTDTEDVTVGKAPTVLQYLGPDAAVVGQPVIVAARLSFLGTPLGGQSVRFVHSGGASCTETTDSNGNVSCSLTPTAATDHGELNLSFAGTSEYEPDTAEAALGVAPSATVTSVSGPASAPFLADVTLTATVSPTDGTGTVSFTRGVAAIAGCTGVPLQLVGALWQAACTTDALPAGDVEITATYSGTADYLGSDDSTTVTVAPTATAATYTGDTAGTVDAPLTLAGTLATVEPAGPVAGRTLTFTIADLSCVGETDAAGAASCTVTPDAVDQSGPVMVVFAGTAEYAATTTGGTVEIDPAASTTTLSGPSAAPFSVPVTFTATVLPPDGGTVAFSADGSPIIGCAAVAITDQGGTGQATCTTATLGVGAHEIAAAFSGTADYDASTAESMTISIAVASTALVYTGPDTATAGTPLEVSARLILDPSAAAPLTLEPAAEKVPIGQDLAASSLRSTGSTRALAVEDVPVVGQVLTFQLGDASCTATTDATGAATCTLTPSASGSTSELRVTFAGGDGFAAAEVVVEVAVAAAPVPPTTPAPTTPGASNPPATPAPTAPTPGTLPATGGNGTPIGLVAAALLVAGVLALAVGLRRPRHRPI